jgi:hypothetical protein
MAVEEVIAMTPVSPRSRSRKVNGYVKAVRALEAVRRKREARHERFVRPLDRKGDALAAEVGRRIARAERDAAGGGAADPRGARWPRHGRELGAMMGRLDRHRVGPAGAPLEHVTTSAVPAGLARCLWRYGRGGGGRAAAGATRSLSGRRDRRSRRRTSDRVIRTDKYGTIVKAHPYHRYIANDRPRGHARAFDVRCPRCRAEGPALSGRDRIGVVQRARSSDR